MAKSTDNGDGEAIAVRCRLNGVELKEGLSRPLIGLSPEKLKVMEGRNKMKRATSVVQKHV